MSTEVAKKKQSPVALLKGALSADSTQQQFHDVLKENAGAFIASLIELYSSDNNLQKCDPNAVIMEALKAASLKLPINKNLGFAYIVPYKTSPQFQMGYKGYIQLAMRTGQFRYLNADKIYDGMRVDKDYLTGKIQILGAAKSDTVTGYFCYMELINGFSKAVYISREEAESHGKRYSQAYQYDIREKKKTCPWSTDFDAMGIKTAIKRLSKYFPMTVEMAQWMDDHDEATIQQEIDENANQDFIDVTVMDVVSICPKCKAEYTNDPKQDDAITATGQCLACHTADEKGPGF